MSSGHREHFNLICRKWETILSSSQQLALTILLKANKIAINILTEVS